MTDSPITPPPDELVQQWYNECPEANEDSLPYVATQAARWGADQELEACCAWLRESLATPSLVECFCTARRPKPQSLKEQALAALQEAVDMADDSPPQGICSDQIDIIRKALEQLDD